MIVKKGSLAIALYILGSVPFFVLIALPVLQGRMDFQFYADSPTYHAAADQLGSGLPLIAIGTNLFGPVLILRLLGNGFVAVYLFNLGLFVLTYRLVVRWFDVDRVRFLLLLMLCPLTFTSLFSINKEILAVMSMVLVAVYLEAETWRHLLMALLLSILVRQQTVVVLVVALVASRVNPLRRHRGITLVLLVAAISIAYPAKLTLFEDLSRIAMLQGAKNAEGSGLFTTFINLQNQMFGYLIVVVPKVLHLYFGHAARWRQFFDWTDVVNNVVMFSQSVVNLVILTLAAWSRRLRLSSGPVFAAAIYAVIIGLTPIFSSRYLFPVTVLLCIELARRRSVPIGDRAASRPAGSAGLADQRLAGGRA